MKEKRKGRGKMKRETTKSRFGRRVIKENTKIK